MKVLVTGGLGFIGSHTVVELQNKGFEVVIIDNLSNSSESVLKGIVAITGKKPLFEKLDLREKSIVQAFFKKHNDISGVMSLKKPNRSLLTLVCPFFINIYISFTTIIKIT